MFHSSIGPVMENPISDDHTGFVFAKPYPYFENMSKISGKPCNSIVFFVCPAYITSFNYIIILSIICVITTSGNTGNNHI